MTGREQPFLALAVEACWEHNLSFIVRRPGIRPDIADRVVSVRVLGEPEREFRGPTLAAALEALLADLGVEVPPEPTAEQVRGLAQVVVGLDSAAAALGCMKAHPDRGVVLALLDEGGER